MDQTSTHTQDSSHTRIPQYLIGSIVPAAVATIFVFARFYSRAVIMKNWGYDDFWILISWMLGCLAMTMVSSLVVRNGVARHSDDYRVLIASNRAAIAKCAFAARVFYQLSLMAVKIAICEFYRRIFSDRKSKIFVWSMIVIVSGFSVGLTVAAVFECSLVPYSWGIYQPPHCIDAKPSVYVSTVLNVGTDIIMLAFIVPKILGLQIARRQKGSLLFLVSLSLLAVIAGIVRLIKTISVYTSTDPNWDSVDISIWSAVEVSTCILCASAAAIKPLLRQISPILFPSTMSHLSRTERTGNSHLDMHARGKSRSTADAIELESQPDLDNTHKGWADRRNSNTSDEPIVTKTGLVQRGGIVKTITHNYTELEPGKVWNPNQADNV